jgi:hypothetical protein
MKKTLLITTMLLGAICVRAQLGINTSFPQGVFHVDGGKDNAQNPSTAQQQDDFVVSANGNVGIGTAAPSAKLEINGGRIAIRDGSQGQGKVLVSDENGIGSWVSVSDNGKSVLWEVSQPNKYITAGTYSVVAAPNAQSVSLSGDAALLESDGFAVSTANPLTSLRVPAGLYLVLVHGQFLNEREYGRIVLWAGDSPSATSYTPDDLSNPNMIYKIWYQEQLTGSVFLYNFPQDTFVHATVRVANTSGTDYGMPFYTVPPFTANYNLKIRFIKLNI